MVIPSYERKESQKPQDLNKLSRLLQHLEFQPASQDEFEDYNNKSPYQICTSALIWWCQDQQREHWPRLLYMAIDILSILVMSAEPERIFSGARHTIS